MLRLKLSDKTDYSITSSFIQMVHRFNSEDISFTTIKIPLPLKLFLSKTREIILGKTNIYSLVSDKHIQ